MGHDEGDAVDFVVHKLALFDELVCAQAVPVIRRVDDDRILQQPPGFQMGHNPPHLIVNQRAVAEIAGADLLKASPAQITQPPHPLDQLLAIGLALPRLPIAGMLGDVVRVVHGKVGFGNQAGGVGSPEIGPDKEGLFLVCCVVWGSQFVDDPYRIFRYKVFDGRFHRPVMQGEHLLVLAAGICTHVATGNRRQFKTLLPQIVGVGVASQGPRAKL